MHRQPRQREDTGAQFPDYARSGLSHPSSNFCPFPKRVRLPQCYHQPAKLQKHCSPNYHVPSWPFGEVQRHPYDFRSQGKNGRHLLVVSSSHFDYLRHGLCPAPIVSVPIEVPVSANAMLSPELRNRHAATRIYHVIRRGTRGRGTATTWAVPAHAQPPTRPQGRTAPS